MSDYPVPEAHYITLAGEYDIARKSELAETFGTITNGLPAIIDMSQFTYATDVSRANWRQCACVLKSAP